MTLTALLAVIRDHLPSGPFRARLQERIERPADPAAAHGQAPRIELREIDQDCFNRWIIADGGTKRLPAVPETRSTARLLDALNALIADFPRADNNFIQSLATFALNNCGVVLISASTIEDAYRLFKSVNNPGEPLSALALARTELLGPQAHDARLCADIAQAWDEIQDQIGDEQFESYVRTVAALVLPGIEKRDLFDIVREISRDAQLAQTFNQKLRTFLLSYRDLDTATINFGFEADNDRINRHIACILNSPFDQWRPAALYWLSKSPPARDSLRFFRALDGLCLGLAIQGYKSSALSARFKSIMSEIHSGTALAHTTSPLYLTEAERRSVKDKISKPIKKAAYLKNLLLRLNVAATDVNVPPFFPKDVEIEHILPQKPKSTGEWSRLFGEAERGDLTYLLGNMTLLTPTKNKSVSNMDFPRRRRGSFPSPKITASLLQPTSPITRTGRQTGSGSATTRFSSTPPTSWSCSVEQHGSIGCHALM